MALTSLMVVELLNITATVAFIQFLRQIVCIFEAQVEATGGLDEATCLVADFHGSYGDLFDTLGDCVGSISFLVD